MPFAEGHIIDNMPKESFVSVELGGDAVYGVFYGKHSKRCFDFSQWFR